MTYRSLLTLKKMHLNQFMSLLCVLLWGAFSSSAWAVTYIPHQKAELQILNKITAKTTSVTVTLKEPFTFEHKITITMHSCFATSPQDVPESVAFLDITQKKPDTGDTPVFSGWMFAKHPALSVLENPLYDIRVLKCLPPALPGSVHVDNQKKAQEQTDTLTPTPDSITAPPETKNEQASKEDKTNKDQKTKTSSQK